MTNPSRPLVLAARCPAAAADGQRAGTEGPPLKMRWNPDLERYEGSVKAAAPGGKTTLDFYASVMSANRMSGDMIATVSVDAGGVRERCRAARGLVFKRQ